MPYTIILLTSRRPDLTPSAFKAHYEDHHMPLVRRQCGDLWPITHTRSYIARSDEGSCDAAVIAGAQTDFEFDCVTQMQFEDETHMQKCFERMAEPQNAEERRQDEERFLDMDRIRFVVVEEVCGEAK